MDTTSFYGSKNRITRHRFLSTAVEEAEKRDSLSFDIVVMPPENDNHNISDEDEEDENILDQDVRPAEVPGEVRY